MSTAKPDRRTKQSFTSKERPSQSSTKPTESGQENAPVAQPKNKRVISNQLPADKPPKTRTNRTTPNLDAEENPAFDNSANATGAGADTRTTKTSMNRIGDGKPKGLSRKPTEMPDEENKNFDVPESELSETERKSDAPIYQEEKKLHSQASQLETNPVFTTEAQEPTDRNTLGPEATTLETKEDAFNSPPREASTDLFSNRLTFSPKLKISPKFAHNLTHKSLMVRSFEKMVLEEIGSGMKPIEEKQFVSEKHFYFDILRELEQVPYDLENDSQIDIILTKACKEDQIAFGMMETKFGKKYAQGLYHLFFKYAKDNNAVRIKMTLGKLQVMLKAFDLFSENLDKERISVIYSRRCPTKLADFAAFVDIWYKVSKTTVPDESLITDKNRFFQSFLDKMFAKHQVIIASEKDKHTRVSVFGGEYGPDNDGLKVLEAHDSLMKHLFTLYESFDISIHNKSVVMMKDFKRFCSDYCVVPIFCSFYEAIELFRRFQIGDKSMIDFRGFIMVLAFMANIGFEKEGLMKKKMNSYPKKLLKFFDMLNEMNTRVSDELIFKHLVKCKD
jgi:hypothetical protein